MFRSTWFSAAMVVWYALVAMPALPAIQLSAAPAHGATCQTVCTCSSCSSGDVCCCAPESGDDKNAAPIFHEDDLKGPLWRPVDCAKKAAWMTGLKAPTITPTGSIEPMALNTSKQVCVIDEQAMPADPIGVPEPPPRTTA